MNEIQFFNLVAEMRNKQRQYFKTRNNLYMQMAIVLEKKVDAYIKDNADKLYEQPKQLSFINTVINT